MVHSGAAAPFRGGDGRESIGETVVGTAASAIAVPAAEPTVRPPSAGGQAAAQVTIEEPSTAEPETSGEPIRIRYSWYWPDLLGPNCATAVGDQCLSPIAGCYPRNAGWSDGARFCRHTQSIGNEYWRTNWASQAAEGVIACPSQWPFGTQLQAFGRTWTCADRGGKIVGSWVDFMTPQPHVKYGTWIEAVLIQ